MSASAERKPESEPERIILTWRNTVGCYALDQYGRDWATFEIINGQTTCARCGATISRGYTRALSDEDVCVAHVEHTETRQPDVS